MLEGKLYNFSIPDEDEELEKETSQPDEDLDLEEDEEWNEELGE